MKLSGSHTVPGEPPRVYALLLDPAVLCRSIPGCTDLAPAGPDEYKMRMNVVISSLSGAFEGSMRVAAQSPPRSFRLLVDGKGRPGFVKGDGTLTLSPNGSATEVGYEGEFQAGGLIAGVGQRLLEVTAKTMIRRFFDKVAAEAAGAERGTSG